MATRCPFSTPPIELGTQIGHLFAILRCLLQQSLVDRRAERDTNRNAYG
jgi:hypothetical protein